MIALDALASMMSDSVIVPTVERITLTRTVSTSSFSMLAFNASAEPCTSAFVDLTGQIFQRHGRSLISFLFDLFFQAMACDLARLLIRIVGHEYIPGTRHLIQTDNFDWCRRKGLLDFPAARAA